jgi:twinkle protein
MKIQSSNTKQTFEFIPENRNVEEHYSCPECSANRKKQKDKCFSWDNSTNRGYCHHCNAAFFEFKPYTKKKEYFIPEWKNITNLTDKAVKWFTGRMISQSTLNKMKVYSDKEWMPQYNKEQEVICFPYFRDGILVNIKFRGPEKSFKQVKDAELIWWNYDCLLNNDEVFICEGEIDALTFIENGFENVVSVPAGAGNNVEYLDNTIEIFEKLNKVYIATDIDTKGIELKDELVRRIGPEKCFILDFEGCKDANEYFCKYGGVKFKDIKCSQAPIKGVITIDDLQIDIQNYIENGLPPGLKISECEIDKYCTWQLGQLAIVTGVPSSGKSEFVDFLCVKFNKLFGWKSAFFTPENYPLVTHVDKLYEKIAGKSMVDSIDGEIRLVMDYINQNFFYILDEDDQTTEKILESAKYLVKSKGIKVLVIDPYNTIDHQYDSHTTETKYISTFLTQLQKFARFNNVLVFLVAHPYKMINGEIPSLYSISGSAHFYNKADYGFVVNRQSNDDNIMTPVVDVYWKKIRFKRFGMQGISKLIYNKKNGRYEISGSDVLDWDNTNWLLKPLKIDPSIQVTTDEKPF